MPAWGHATGLAATLPLVLRAVLLLNTPVATATWAGEGLSHSRSIASVRSLETQDDDDLGVSAAQASNSTSSVDDIVKSLREDAGGGATTTMPVVAAAHSNDDGNDDGNDNDRAINAEGWDDDGEDDSMDITNGEDGEEGSESERNTDYSDDDDGQHRSDGGGAFHRDDDLVLPLHALVAFVLQTAKVRGEEDAQALVAALETVATTYTSQLYGEPLAIQSFVTGAEVKKLLPQEAANILSRIGRPAIRAEMEAIRKVRAQQLTERQPMREHIESIVGLVALAAASVFIVASVVSRARANASFHVRSGDDNAFTEMNDGAAVPELQAHRSRESHSPLHRARSSSPSPQQASHSFKASPDSSPGPANMR